MPGSERDNAPFFEALTGFCFFHYLYIISALTHYLLQMVVAGHGLYLYTIAQFP